MTTVHSISTEEPAHSKPSARAVVVVVVVAKAWPAGTRPGSTALTSDEEKLIAPANRA